MVFFRDSIFDDPPPLFFFSLFFDVTLFEWLDLDRREETSEKKPKVRLEKVLERRYRMSLGESRERKDFDSPLDCEKLKLPSRRKGKPTSDRVLLPLNPSDL